MRRVLGISFGVATHAVFAVTVWHLFFFLRDTECEPCAGALAIDALLALQFVVPHSVLLLPSVRGKLGRWIKAEFYGCFYCVVTCVSLLVTFAGWRSCPIRVWDCTGLSATLVRAGFYGSWVLLFYSLNLTGLGYQTGLTQWLHWLRGEKLPRRDFQPRGLYHWLRHPVYLSFLGLIWFTPTMTADHAMLTAIWTVYIFVGSYLKDRRLAFYLGDSYRSYQQRVAGYPFLPIGPLGRLPIPT